MQLISASRDELLKPLLMVAGIVERRNTMPILANVLIRKNGADVSFIATDLEVQISAHATFGVDQDQAELTVNARKLIDILRALPATGDVRLSLNASKLVIQSGKSRFSLQTVSATEFPTLTELVKRDLQVTLTSSQLKHLFNMTYFAMAHQDIRYYLNGTLMVFQRQRVHTVGTDAHRLAHCSLPVDKVEGIEPEGVMEDLLPIGEVGAVEEVNHGEVVEAIEKPEPSVDVIIPRKTVLEMQRLLPDSEDPVIVDVGIGQIRFRYGDVELISKLVEGKFPDYKRVIPTGYTRHFEVDRERLLGSLNRAAIMTSDKLRSVRIQLENNVMTVSSRNAEQEDALEEIDIDYSFEPLDVGFNVAYLQEFLSSVKAETVQWSVMPDTNASILLSVPGDESFQYVVMPMRM